MRHEEWRDVPGMEEYLQVSSQGRVKSKARTVLKRHQSGRMMEQHYEERVLQPKPNPEGYIAVSVGFGGRRHRLMAHRLVLLAFVGPAPDGMEACHNNGRPGDNQVENLRWDTHRNNNGDRVKHGTYAAGSAHHMAKITDADAMAIYASDEPGAVLAARYGIAETKISAIRRGVTWRSVTGGKTRDMAKVIPRRTDKMDSRKAQEARGMRRNGASLREIAERFGISESTASGICANKTWVEA